MRKPGDTFLSTALVVGEKRDHGVDLVGPARRDQRRQAREGKGFAAEHFQIDWDGRHMTCPAGHESSSWTEVEDHRGRPLVKVKFSSRDCKVCEFYEDCTKQTRRTVTLQARESHEALVAWREREGTEAFGALYAKRAGIEGTVSLGVRACGMRRSRYAGLGKTRLGHLATGSAVNLARVADWLGGRPRATTRLARFERVLQQAA